MAADPVAAPAAGPRRRRRLRRVLLVATAAVVLSVAVPVAVAGVALSRAAVSTVGEVAFDTPLAIPPLDEGTVDVDGRRVFDLTVREGETDFGFDRPTPTWGIDGDHLAPTLRMRDGEPVAVRVANDLPEATTIHWHGMHLPAAADGGPHQMIPPGRAWRPDWTVDQPAATLWYHPHLHATTTEHVYRGVLGMIIVDDDESAALGLPSEYGVDDVPVILADRRFTADGELSTEDGFMSLTGLLGDTAMVNGTIGGYHEVTTERVRLRLLNSSTGRIWNLGFADGRAFELVAGDGGLLPAPVTLERLQLSPGERAEVVVTMAPGERALLRSFRPDLRAFVFQTRLSGGHDSFDLLELRAVDSLAPSPEVPATLVPDAGAPDPAAASRTRYLQLQGNQINGREMDAARIDAVVTAGSTEVWEVSNGDGYPHNFHLHDVGFRVLDVDGEPPAPHEAGRKDTVLVPPGATVRLVVGFGRHTDPDRPYMYHCHLLRHEDDGMMGQFVVVAEGEEAGVPLTGEGHLHDGP